MYNRQENEPLKCLKSLQKNSYKVIGGNSLFSLSSPQESHKSDPARTAAHELAGV